MTRAIEGGLVALLYAEAYGMKTDGPFSFVDRYGTRATRVNVCGGDVITAANCVDFRSDYTLIIQTTLMPLCGRAA